MVYSCTKSSDAKNSIPIPIPTPTINQDSLDYTTLNDTEKLLIGKWTLYKGTDSFYYSSGFDTAYYYNTYNNTDYVEFTSSVVNTGSVNEWRSYKDNCGFYNAEPSATNGTGNTFNVAGPFTLNWHYNKSQHFLEVNNFSSAITQFSIISLTSHQLIVIATIPVVSSPYTYDIWCFNK